MLLVLLVEFVVDLEAVRFVVIGLCEGCAYGCRGRVEFVGFFCFCFLLFVAVVLIVFFALVVEVCGGGGL